MLSDQKEMKKTIIKKKVNKEKKKPLDFLALNRKYLNGRTSIKKFGLIETKSLGPGKGNFNSTDNLLLTVTDNLKKKFKKTTKKKSIKPDVSLEQDISRKLRER